MFIHRTAMLLCTTLLSAAAYAADIQTAGVWEIAVEAGLPAPRTRTYEFRPTLVLLNGSGWTQKQLVQTVHDTAEILKQCGLRIPAVSLVTLDAPAAYLGPNRSQRIQIARSLTVGTKPLVFFIHAADDVLNDAFSYGRANTQEPSLRDTVWVKNDVADIAGVVMAHELVHVLTNSGEHVEEPDNLMHADADATTIGLKPEQCQALIKRGQEQGLLRANKR